MKTKQNTKTRAKAKAKANKKYVKKEVQQRPLELNTTMAEHGFNTMSLKLLSTKGIELFSAVPYIPQQEDAVAMYNSTLWIPGKAKRLSHMESVKVASFTLIVREDKKAKKLTVKVSVWTMEKNQFSIRSWETSNTKVNKLKVHKYATQFIGRQVWRPNTPANTVLVIR
jgi:hypothetical protein